MLDVDDLLAKAERVFEKLIRNGEEMLSRRDIVKLVGEEDYAVVRGALIATDKVESLFGRTGGVRIKRASGNRREWGQSAENKARRYLASEAELESDDSVAALEQIWEEWPQSRIAEALSVSQATVSNWLRTGVVGAKYSEGIRELLSELKRDKPRANGESSALPDDHAQETAYADWLRSELEHRESNAVDLAKRSGVNVNTILALLEGRTENPQQRTRERIAKALDVDVKADDGSEQDEPWYYIGLPWTDEEIDQVPDRPGVYIIHDRLGRPAYIGVAHKGASGVRGRLRKHNGLRWTIDKRVAATFSYALTDQMPASDASELAKSIEKLLIKFMGNALLINEKDVEDLVR